MGLVLVFCTRTSLHEYCVYFGSRVITHYYVEHVVTGHYRCCGSSARTAPGLPLPEYVATSLELAPKTARRTLATNSAPLPPAPASCTKQFTKVPGPSLVLSLYFGVDAMHRGIPPSSRAGHRVPPLLAVPPCGGLLRTLRRTLYTLETFIFVSTTPRGSSPKSIRAR